jgi:hypothetical protein
MDYLAEHVTSFTIDEITQLRDWVERRLADAKEKPMKAYRVLVARTIVEHAYVEVQAENEGSASKAAITKAQADESVAFTFHSVKSIRATGIEEVGGN